MDINTLSNIISMVNNISSGDAINNMEDAIHKISTLTSLNSVLSANMSTSTPVNRDIHHIVISLANTREHHV